MNASSASSWQFSLGTFWKTLRFALAAFSV